MATQGLFAGERDVEWEHAIMQACWGAFLLLPAETFAGPQYALLAALAPAEVWGACGLGLGLVRLAALAINGAWRRTPALRLAGSLIGISWWLGLGTLLLLGPEHHVPAGVVFYPVLAAFEGRSCWRGAADAYHAGTFRRRIRRDTGEGPPDADS